MVSTGHPAITAGTIGARVRDVAGNIYALSNNHVYADENLASINDNVLQPGAYDGGTDPDDAIGTLFDFELDAVIALSPLGDLGNATPSDGYGTPKSETVMASLNQKVQKYGRTTTLTKGTITGINATLNIGYGSGTARFVNQIIVENRKPGFIQGGDSGSLLVIQGGADDRKPVGLLYAGTSTGKMAIANPIDAVLTRFGVTVDDGSGPPPPTPATGVVAGTVTESADGLKIGGATVTVDTGQSATTGTDGAYNISDVPIGDRSVTASAGGYGSQTSSATVVEDQTTSPIDFSLEAANITTMIVSDTSFRVGRNKNGKVTSLVLDVTVTDGTNPVPGAAVSVKLTRPDGTVFASTALTNNDGKVGFSTAGKLKSGIWTGDITGVTKDNYQLNAAASDLTAEVDI